MAVITKAAGAGLDTWGLNQTPQGFGPGDASQLGADHKVGPYIAGETLAPLAPCYIKAADGKAYQSIGTTLGNEAAKVAGYCLNGAAIGSYVYLCFDIDVYYGSGLTPGAFVYLSATLAALDTAASAGGVNPIGVAIDTQRIRLRKSMY